MSVFLEKGGGGVHRTGGTKRRRRIGEWNEIQQI